MYFKVSIFCLFITFFFDSLSYGQTPFKIGAEQVPPFEYQDDEGPQGIDVEMVRLIFEKIGVPYQIVFGDESGRALEKAQKGHIDAILSVSYREERTEFLIYPEGFNDENTPQNFMWMSEYVFFGRSETLQSLNINSLEDIKKAELTVGTIDGVSYSPDFWDAKLKVKKGASDEENFNRLLKGDIDLYLTDKLIGRYTIKKMNVKKEVDHFPMKLIQKPYTLAFVKSSKHTEKDKVIATFYKELDLLKKSGVAKQIFLKELY